ncbi:MAG: hypothetical protein ACREX9_21150 [Gammaproteobacteria bacterium]
MATTLQPIRYGWVARDALRQRVTREITRRGARDAESWAETLSLLGAAVAIGIRIPPVNADWPDNAKLAAILDLRILDLFRNAIIDRQVQLWLGLREMARLWANPVTVPPQFGNRILALWQATQEGQTADSLPPHVRASNAEMIAWLERCRAAGWRLVPWQTERAKDDPDMQT